VSLKKLTKVVLPRLLLAATAIEAELRARSGLPRKSS
jgi:hypothetical protein